MIRAKPRRIVPVGGYLVREDDFRLTYAAIQIALLPPSSRFRTTDLAELYSDLCKRHSLEMCELHGDQGAEFSTEDVNRVELQRDSLEMSERVQRSFDIIRKDFADMAGVIKEKFKIQVFAEPWITFRALWPMPPGKTASDAMRENAIGLKDDQFGLLANASLDAVGININADTQGGHFSLKVMPYSRDVSQLFLEFSQHQHALIESVSILEQHLESAYQYFTETTTKFVASFMP